MFKKETVEKQDALCVEHVCKREREWEREERDLRTEKMRCVI